MAERDLREQIHDALSDLFHAIDKGGRATWRFLRSTILTDANLAWIRALLWDAFRSLVGVVRVTPSIRGSIRMFGDEIVGTAVGWSAGLAAAALVGQFFQARGLGNLFGLLGGRDKMLVSRETYELLTGVAGFAIGLLVLIAVRHFVRSWLAEFERVRRQRSTERPIDDTGPSEPPSPPTPEPDPKPEAGD